MRNKVKRFNGNRKPKSKALPIGRIRWGCLLLAILTTTTGCDFSTTSDTKLNQPLRSPAQFGAANLKQGPSNKWSMRDYDLYASRLRDEVKAITSDKTIKCDPQRIKELVKTLSQVGTGQKHLFLNQEYLYSILFESLVPLYGNCQDVLRSQVNQLPLKDELAFKGELCAVLREEAEGQDPPPGESSFKDSWCNMFEE